MAARLVSGVFDWNVRGIDIIRRLEWQTIRARRGYFAAVLMHSCLKGDAPYYLSQYFTKVQHRYCTRQSLGDLCVPRPNIEPFKQCLLYQGPILWNNLTKDLKCSSDILSFKRLNKIVM